MTPAARLIWVQMYERTGDAAVYLADLFGETWHSTRSFNVYSTISNFSAAVQRWR